jgi:glutamate-1-semialdehyde 2,1-aminomutase
MGVVPPEPGFLEGLRRITRESGSLLVFDEVITGFRVAPGGAQERYGVTADMTCLGKVLGHGTPLSAYGGRRDIMETVAPLGPVYQAGTLAGNSLVMAAGLATMDRLRPELYRRLERQGDRLERGLHDAADDADVPLQVPRVGSMMGLFFQPEPVRNYRDAQGMDRGAYGRFFWALLRRGVYLPPAPFESLFVSAAHDSAEIEKTIDAAAAAFREARNP